MTNSKIEIQINFIIFDKPDSKRWPYNTPISAIYEELNELCKTFHITSMDIVINDVIIPQKND